MKPAASTGCVRSRFANRPPERPNVFGVFERGYERKSQHQRVAAKMKPHGLPVGNAVLSVILHHFTAHNAAREDTASEAVGHHQEHPLRAGAAVSGVLLFRQTPSQKCWQKKSEQPYTIIDNTSRNGAERRPVMHKRKNRRNAASTPQP